MSTPDASQTLSPPEESITLPSRDSSPHLTDPVADELLQDSTYVDDDDDKED